MDPLSTAIGVVSFGANLLSGSSAKREQNKYSRAQRFAINQTLSMLPELEESAQSLYNRRVEMLQGSRGLSMEGLRQDVSGNVYTTATGAQEQSGISGFSGMGRGRVDLERQMNEFRQGYQTGVEGITQKFLEEDLSAYSNLQSRLEDIEMQRQNLLVQRAGLKKSKWTESPLEGGDVSDEEFNILNSLPGIAQQKAYDIMNRQGF
jgi:hypothetical protein